MTRPSSASFRPLALLATSVLAVGSLAAPASAQTPLRFESQRILASDGEPGDLFGSRVAIEAGTLIITSAADGDAVEDSGSAYVFEEGGDGNWIEVQKLIPRDVNPFARFGASLSLDGDRFVAGAVSGQQGEIAAGAAWVFERIDGRWVEAGRLAAPGGLAGDRFGQAVAIQDDLILVGAFQSSAILPQGGVVYLFERGADGVFAPAGQIAPDDGAAEDRFGFAIRIDGDIVLVSAITANDLMGAVYVFERTGAGFVQRDRLVSEAGGPVALFGQSLDVSEQRIAIASQLGPELGGPRLTVDIYERSGDAWPRVDTVQIRTARGIAGDLVRLQGDRLVLGAPGLLETADDEGAVFVFDRIEGVWTLTRELRASDGMALDGLGNAVDVSGSTVIAAQAIPASAAFPPQPTYVFDLDRPDSDGDGFDDGIDNCPGVSNADQLDSNLDGTGDACTRSGGGGGGCSVSPSAPTAPTGSIGAALLLGIAIALRRSHREPTSAPR